MGILSSGCLYIIPATSGCDIHTESLKSGRLAVGSLPGHAWQREFCGRKLVEEAKQMV
jgi:hypothetical protein